MHAQTLIGIDEVLKIAEGTRIGSIGLQLENSSRSTNNKQDVPERLPKEILVGSKENLSGKSPANDSANASEPGQSSSSNPESWFKKARKVEE